MKKTVVITGAIIGLFASIALFADTQEKQPPDEICNCTWLKPKRCTITGWGFQCAPDLHDGPCSDYDRNCGENFSHDN